MLSFVSSKLGTFQDRKEEDIQHHFRRLSRRLIKGSCGDYLHYERIKVACNFRSSEPLQGAIADYFYQYWYDVNHTNEHIISLLEEIKPQLSPHIYQEFVNCVYKKDYINKITILATAWSVLVTPSMDMPLHKLKTSKDNTLYVIDTVINKLTIAHEQQDIENIHQIEDAFFEHCLICSDLIAFMKVWFRLNKQGWQPDDRWQDCRNELEKLN